MDGTKIDNIVSLFEGMTKDEWNTLRTLIDTLYERKTIESGIQLNGSEVAKYLRKAKR